ncbi:MAG: hypothetical protein WC718_03475 [Phycisphaerales bacterium]|jgi:hypothetical protein
MTDGPNAHDGPLPVDPALVAPDATGESLLPAPSTDDEIPDDPPRPRSFFTTAPKPDPWAHRRGEPRTFAALWIILLFMAAVVSIGSAGATGLVSIDVYRAGARIMLCIIGASLGLIWPMVRLSQEAPDSPRRSMAQDIFVVAAPLQAMTWPQCLPWMAAYPIPPIAALSANFLAWTILIAGLLALLLERAKRDPATSRAALMAIIAAICFAGPAIGLLTRHPTLTPESRVDLWQLSSPVTAPWEIVRDRTWTGYAAAAASEHWFAAAIIGTVAGFVWVFVLASSRREA